MCTCAWIYVCLSGLWLGGLLYLFFLYFLKASVLSTYISMDIHERHFLCAIVPVFGYALYIFHVYIYYVIKQQRHR